MITKMMVDRDGRVTAFESASFQSVQLFLFIDMDGLVFAI